MFKGLGSLGSLLKGAQQLRADLERVQEELKERRVQGSAGGGMVVIEMNGRQEVLACRIEPELVARQDREMLEELIVAAMHQALEKSRAVAAEEMAQLAGGLPIPGLGEALGQLGPFGSDS